MQPTPNGCPAPRQRKNGVPDAINHKPDATNHKPVVTNHKPDGANQKPDVTNGTPDGTNHKPVATNGTPVVTDIVRFIPCFSGFLASGTPVTESQGSFLVFFEGL